MAVAGPPDRNTPSEENLVQVYRTEARRLNVVFSETAFNYAKAISCLRLISIIRVSYMQKWLFSQCQLAHLVCVCVHTYIHAMHVYTIHAFLYYTRISVYYACGCMHVHICMCIYCIHAYVHTYMHALVACMVAKVRTVNTHRFELWHIG